MHEFLLVSSKHLTVPKLGAWVYLAVNGQWPTVAMRRLPCDVKATFCA